MSDHQHMAKAPTTPQRTNRKAQIVATAESLLRTRGLNGVTTRAIAEAVPCSEGAIYVHFKDRLELLLEVLQQSLPEMLIPLHALQARVGTATPERNLIDAIKGLLSFHQRVAPMLCSLSTEPELLQRFQQSLGETHRGPHRGISTLATYISQEQKLGRIDKAVDTNTAATILMSCSFFHVFTSNLLGSSSKLDLKKVIKSAISSR
jgi:AcrR family transcriptional regulator